MAIVLILIRILFCIKPQYMAGFVQELKVGAILAVPDDIGSPLWKDRASPMLE